MKRMNRTLKILAVLLCGILSAACTKEKLQATYNTQEDQINKYIETSISKDTTRTVTHNNGSNRLTLVHGTGEELSAHGSLTFYYAGYTFSGSFSSSNLFTTNREASAVEAGWSLTDAAYDALTLDLKDATLLHGLKNGLVGVKAGEECEIIFSGKYGFGDRTFGTIPATSALLYKIWVVSITND